MVQNLYWYLEKFAATKGIDFLKSDARNWWK
jgi:hypothetical protein